jgi:protein-disulfide isomerase
MAGAVRAVSGTLGVLVVTAVLAACAPPRAKPGATQPAGPTLSAEEQQRLVRYYARRANVVSDDVRVSELRPTPVAGLSAGLLDTANGRVPFTIAGGRWVLFAPLEDLTADPFADLMQRISLAGVPVRGPADAKVTIVEYGDFECPYSARAYDTIENQVLPQYGTRVRFAYKHLPLSLHHWAEPAAIAAECVKEQSLPAFWTVYAGFFQNQATIGNSNLKDAVEGFVADTGIDLVKFRDCFDERRPLVAVRTQAQEAVALGVQATPTFFVNGRRISGAAPFETFAGMIDSELAWR